MTAIFIDTLYLVALMNPKDQWHSQAREAKETYKFNEFVTTEAILIELLNFFSSFSPQMRQAVALTVYDVLEAPDVEVISINNELFLSGLTLYEQRLDKGYSMVDCL